MKISGKFDVSLDPLEFSVQGVDKITLSRLSIDKTFHGELNAKSKGEMISARTAVPGSAGYVAIEQVEGTLDGRSGSFVLQHFGIMNKGESRLVLEVVPDSGAGDLVGLSGTMTIKIEDQQHYYEFEYQI
ncbi:DUF3224 domain-containing protein [Aurantivibrio infirmus]